MKRASIAELKARLSEFVAIAKAGEVVIVTDRGRPVARLAPLDASTAADARMDELIRTRELGEFSSAWYEIAAVEEVRLEMVTFDERLREAARIEGFVA